MAERSFEVSGFSSIELCGRHDVIVMTGAKESVRAEGDEEALEELSVRASSGVLSLDNRRHGLFRRRFNRSPLTIYVTMPEIRGASIAGSGDIHVDRVEGESFRGSIAGSGDIAIDEMAVDVAQFAIAGSGDVKAAGRARQAAIRIAGSGDGDLSALIAEEADISVAGSGDVRAHATSSARVRVRGSGDVEMTGGAKCTVSKHGSGDVRCS